MRGLVFVVLCSGAIAAATAQVATPAAAPAAAQVTAAPQPATQAFPGGTGTRLGQQIQDLLAEPLVHHAHWGIAVTTLDGTPVYGLEEARFFRPASTAKLFTTAAVMALLGPDARFVTGVYGNLNSTTGVVQGDLVLVGAGDASFGVTEALQPDATTQAPSRDLEDLAGQLVTAGVRSIRGNLVGDDQLFAQEPPPGGWAAEDLVWGYGALPDALSYASDQLRLTLQPRAALATTADPSPPARLDLEQRVPFVHLANNVATEPPAVAGLPDNIEVSPVPGQPHTLLVAGNLSPATPPRTEHIALPDPARYTAEALRALLAQRSVTLAGHATALHSTSASPPPFLATVRAPEDCATSTVQGADCALECASVPHSGRLLAQHTSAPLYADVQYTLKTSANFHAEVMLRHLEAKLTCAGATSAGSMRLLQAWLLQAGLPAGDVVLYDGSGLSTKDLVTPRSEVQLLAYAVTQPWYAQWRAGLPLAGTDGTLAARFLGPALKGNVAAKTGTLGESRALAGYVRCSSGRELIFSILVDNHDPSSSADRVVMDKIVEAVAANN